MIGGGLCELCPLGTYREQGQSTKCLQCPSNSTTKDVGASSESNCSRGYYPVIDTPSDNHGSLSVNPLSPCVCSFQFFAMLAHTGLVMILGCVSRVLSVVTGTRPWTTVPCVAPISEQTRTAPRHNRTVDVGSI